MKIMNVTKKAIALTLVSSIVLTGCDGFRAAKNNSKPAAAGKSVPELQTAIKAAGDAASKVNVEDIKSKLPFFKNGYTGKTAELFFNFIQGEATMDMVVQALAKLTPEEFSVARYEMQMIIKQLKELNLYGEKQKNLTKGLSAVLEMHLANKAQGPNQSVVDAYFFGTLIGALVGVGTDQAVVSRIRSGMSKIAKRIAPGTVEAIKNSRATAWLKNKPVPAAELAETVTVRYANFAGFKEAAKVSGADQAYFIDLLGAASLTNVNKLKNTQAFILSDYKAAEDYLKTSSVKWSPTRLSGVRMGSTQDRLVLEMVDGQNTILVGYKRKNAIVASADDIATNTRLDQGDESTLELARIVGLKKEKEELIQTLSIQYGEAKKAANAGTLNHTKTAEMINQAKVDQLKKADEIGATIKEVSEKWLNGQLDAPIRYNALLSAEARYNGRLEVRKSLREQIQKLNARMDSTQTQALQYDKSHGNVDFDVIEGRLQQMAFTKSSVETQLRAINAEIGLMDDYVALVQLRRQTRDKHPNGVAKQLAEIDTEIAAQIEKIVELEAAQAASASSAIAVEKGLAQDINGTIAEMSKQNEALALILSDRQGMAFTNLRSSQIEFVRIKNAVLGDSLGATAARASIGGVIGMAVIGGTVDANLDGWEDISSEDLEAMIEQLPVEEKKEVQSGGQPTAPAPTTNGKAA